MTRYSAANRKNTLRTGKSASGVTEPQKKHIELANDISIARRAVRFGKALSTKAAAHMLATVTDEMLERSLGLKRRRKEEEKYSEYDDEKKAEYRAKTIKHLKSEITLAGAQGYGVDFDNLQMIVLDSESLPLTIELKQVFPTARITVVEYWPGTFRKQVEHGLKYSEQCSGPAPRFCFGNLLEYPLEGVHVLIADMTGQLVTPPMREYARERLGPWLDSREAIFASVTRTCRGGRGSKGPSVYPDQQDRTFQRNINAGRRNCAAGSVPKVGMHLGYIQGWKRAVDTPMNALEFCRFSRSRVVEYDRDENGKRIGYTKKK